MTLFVNDDRHTWMLSRSFLFIIFLKSLDQMVVSFSSKGAWTSWFSISWLRGTRGSYKNWLLRTGNCRPVWRNNGIKAIWNIIGIASLLSPGLPSTPQNCDTVSPAHISKTLYFCLLFVYRKRVYILNIGYLIDMLTYILYNPTRK